MTKRTIATCLLAALSLLASGHALAAADDDDEDQDDSYVGPWALSLATQVDRLSTRGLNAELAYDLWRDTTIRIQGDSVDYSSAQGDRLRSQGVELGVLHDFGRFDVDAAVGRWQSTDVLTARELKLGGNVHSGPWSAGLRTGYRRADFDPFSNTITLQLGGMPTPFTAISRCRLDNTAIGADGRYEGDTWGGYATAMRYNYRSADCNFDVIGFGRRRAREAGAKFRTLAANQLARLTSVATRRIGRQETLLDSSLDAGLSWKHHDLTLSLDGTREKDFFIGANSTIVSVTVTADLGFATAVDVTLGDTRGGSPGTPTGAFVGFALRTRF